MRKPRETTPIKVDCQGVVASHEHVDTHIELLPPKQKRIHNVALYDIRFALLRLWRHLLRGYVFLRLLCLLLLLRLFLFELLLIPVPWLRPPHRNLIELANKEDALSLTP